MPTNKTVDEMEADLGEKLKRMRLNKNLEQKTLAARAGVSVRALRNLESGAGSTVKTLLSIVGALGRGSWLETVAPISTINPVTMTSRATQRVRATSRSKGVPRLPADARGTARNLHAMAHEEGPKEAEGAAAQASR